MALACRYDKAVHAQHTYNAPTATVHCLNHLFFFDRADERCRVRIVLDDLMINVISTQQRLWRTQKYDWMALWILWLFFVFVCCFKRQAFQPVFILGFPTKKEMKNRTDGFPIFQSAFHFIFMIVELGIALLAFSVATRNMDIYSILARCYGFVHVMVKKPNWTYCGCNVMHFIEIRTASRYKKVDGRTVFLLLAWIVVVVKSVITLTCVSSLWTYKTFLL